MRRDLVGSTVVITGGNAGLGYFAAEQLACRGARIVVASRSEAKAQAALASLARQVPDLVDPEFVHLDLADLTSVVRASEQLAAIGRIDVLIANAGTLEGIATAKTADGFESMFGTNHLGHFALIARLLPTLMATPHARIVHLGSISHRFYPLDLDNPMADGNFRSFRSYSRSKLSVMTFAFELDRRLRNAGHELRSIVAHPGFAVDELTPDRAGVTPPNSTGQLVRQAWSAVAQGKDAGATPIVMAATDDYLRGGEYVGPAGWQQLKGRPRVTRAKAWSRDRAIAARLWSISETLTATSIAL